MSVLTTEFPFRELVTAFGENNFTLSFLHLNQRNGSEYAQWMLYPGMLFDSSRKWWGDWKYRTSRHEGLDLAFYQDKNRVMHCISEGLLVPALYPGHVRLIIQDFLGWTVFLEHPQFSKKDSAFCSLYAHLDLNEPLTYSLSIQAGQPLGRTVNTGAKIKLAPHIHLSLGWFPKQVLDRISWPMINTRENMLLIDPLKILHIQYDLLKETHS
jgi:hypothetical protein